MTDVQRRRQAREHDARRADAAEAAIRRIDAAGTKAACKIMAALQEMFTEARAAGPLDVAGKVDEFIADLLFAARDEAEDVMIDAGFGFPPRPDYTTGATTPPTSPLPRSV